MFYYTSQEFSQPAHAIRNTKSDRDVSDGTVYYTKRSSLADMPKISERCHPIIAERRSASEGRGRGHGLATDGRSHTEDEKCMVFEKKVDYLGNTILPGKLGPEVEPTKEIQETQLHNEKTKMRSFHGACNVYRRFVWAFAQIENPTNAMLHKEAEVNWSNPTEEQLDAFKIMKSRLEIPPNLGLPKRGCPYMIDMDASQ